MNEYETSSTEVTDIEDIEDSYNQLPYPSHCFPQTHPDRLYTIARLFGVQAPAPESSRILEIGCASGGNLLPMAEQLPNAELLGIDLAEKQIEQGRRLIDSFGMSNIQLRQLDVMEIDHSLGQFDYILCHGVYSWVPEAVQQKILETFRSHLRPTGVGYLSFNTYPGWHMRGMIRDMMCYHVKNLKAPGERVAQARALLSFLAKNVKKEDSAYGMLLHQELGILQRQSDSYLFHEHLERFNQPIYFHQFVEAIARYSLQYLGDASISSMWIGNFPDDVAGTLKKIAPDIHQREQYSDFLRNRTFRQALVVHGDLTIDRNLTPPRVADARISGQFTGIDQRSVDLNPSVSISFVETKSKRKVSSANPVFKSAIVHLSNRWPEAIPINELYDVAQNSLQVDRELDRDQIAAEKSDFQNQLIQLFVSGLVQIKYSADRYVHSISSTPQISPLARGQTEVRRIANRRHELLAVDDFMAQLCRLLDGTRDRSDLVQHLESLVKQRAIDVKVDGHPATGLDDSQLKQALSKAVDRGLAWLCKNALLVG